MRIGDLRQRVDLETPTNTADGMGGQTVAWSTFTTVWAAVWPVSASEQVQAGQQAMTITHRIRIRWRSGVTSDMRVKFGSRYFAIVGIVTPNEIHRQIDLLCKEAA